MSKRGFLPFWLLLSPSFALVLLLLQIHMLFLFRPILSSVLFLVGGWGISQETRLIRRLRSQGKRIDWSLASLGFSSIGFFVVGCYCFSLYAFPDLPAFQMPSKTGLDVLLNEISVVLYGVFTFVIGFFLQVSIALVHKVLALLQSTDQTEDSKDGSDI